MTKEKKVILLDVDDTLAPYSKNFYYISKHVFGYNFPPPSDWRWHTISRIIGKEKYFEIMMATLNKISTDPPFSESVYFTHLLKEKGYDICILTHRPIDLYDKTKQWLDKYNFAYDNLIVTDKPKYIFADSNTVALYDDAPHTLKDFKKNRPHVKLFARKMRYNKDIKGVVRFSSLLDTIKFL